MSFTVTQTIHCSNSIQNLVLVHLQALQSTKEKTLALVAEIKNTELFSIDATKKIDEFTQEFALLDPNNESCREQVSLLLCFLLCDVVRHALCQEEEIEKQNQLIDFDDTLYKLLEVTVPSNETVDQFIETFENYSQEEEFLEEKLKLIEDCFNEQMKNLYQHANQVNQEIKQKFEELKYRLVKINESRQVASIEINKKLDYLTQRVEKIAKILEGFFNDQEKIADRIQDDQKNFNKRIDEFKSLLGKVP